MAYVDTSKPSSTPNAKPAKSPTPNTATSPVASRLREATWESLDKDRERLKTADLSKVKVW